MKNKILFIIVIFLVTLLVILSNWKTNKNNSSNPNETSSNFILKSDTNSSVNTSGENSGVYVGLTDQDKDNYIFVSIKIDKKASPENQVKSLISEISDAINYKIDINSVEINDNKIKIDFAKTAAPFELQESRLNSENPKYIIQFDDVVGKTIFDSINKTLKSYFGEETEVYFSADSENINIQNETLTLNIDLSKPY